MGSTLMSSVAQQIRSRLPLAGAVAFSAAHFASFEIFSRPLVTDIRYYTYFSWRVAEGAVPHADFFGNKTQLAALVGGLLFPIGEFFGDALIGLRVGFLAFAALACVLAFEVHRRLGGNHAVAGFLGLIACCAFPLMGILPAIGPIPKLLMAVFASIMGLCVHRRRWFLAGVVSAFAFMDWQVGAMAGVGACVAALVCGTPRVRAFLAVVAGGVAGFAPFAIYFAWNGALGAFVRQVFGAALSRGTASMSESTVGSRWEHIRELAESVGASVPALFYLGGLGIAVALWWGWKKRGDEAHPMLVALGVYHVGVLAFNLVDFQHYGDFFIVLHSVAFFLALVFCFGYEQLANSFSRGAGPKVVGAVFLLVALALARPGPLRPAEVPSASGITPLFTLDDQRAVARAVGEDLAGKRIFFLQNVEVAYFMRYPNPTQLIYWNQAARTFARASEGESQTSTLVRILRDVDPDAFTVSNRRVQSEMSEYRPRAYRSDGDRYKVTLRVRVRRSSAALGVSARSADRG
jgi:hypothetical protein